jgi:predicted double-glycine peptidase
MFLEVQMISNLLKNNNNILENLLLDERGQNDASILQRYLSRAIDEQARNTRPQAYASPAYKNFMARFYGLTTSQNLTFLNVHGHQQSEEYTCGAATIMSLMHYYGMLTAKDLTREMEMKISAEMGTCKDYGTSVPQMTAWLENNGFDVESGENGTIAMLQENLRKGIPTLVEWMDWGGHWSLAAGYNAGPVVAGKSTELLFLADSSAKHTSEKTINGVIRVNANRFKSMWFDAQYFNPGKIVRGIYIKAVPKK